MKAYLVKRRLVGIFLYELCILYSFNCAINYARDNLDCPLSKWKLDSKFQTLALTKVLFLNLYL